MATTKPEGQSVQRPPYFDGTNYNCWKVRMRIFLQSLSYDLWDIVEIGYKTPQITESETKTSDTTATTVSQVSISKPRETWSTQDKDNFSLNARAMNALYCSLDTDDFNRITQCKTAKEIWDKLEVTYEGTNQVKDSRISALLHKYELFKMNPDEKIIEMNTRFTHIVNGLTALGREIPVVEQIRKILQALPKKWRPKVTAIEEAKDLRKMSIEQLMGSLTTHEVILEEEEDKPRKGIAFRASDETSDVENEDMALLTKNFKKFLIQRKNGRRDQEKRLSFRPKGEKEKDDRECFNCHQRGHIAAECNAPRKPKWRKALAATWDDDEESDVSDSEVSEFGFIASIDENCNDDESRNDVDDDDIYDAFEKLFYESKKIAQKNKNLE